MAKKKVELMDWVQVGTPGARGEVERLLAALKDTPPNPPDNFTAAGRRPAEQAHQFSGPGVRTGFRCVLSVEDVKEVQELDAMTQRHEALVMLIGEVYSLLAYGKTDRAEIANKILDSATIDERLLHRLVAIDCKAMR